MKKLKTHLGILQILEDGKPVSAERVAKLIGCHRATCMRILDAMHATGAVTKRKLRIEDGMDRAHPNRAPLEEDVYALASCAPTEVEEGGAQ
jgi:DNA-binding Lrp family transcriptional regulator